MSRTQTNSPALR